MDREKFYQKKSVRQDVDCNYKDHISEARAFGRGPECPAQPWGRNEPGSPHDAFEAVAA